jgi:hypothetical protein
MSHEAFATWGAALAEVGDAGQALMAAIDRGDVIAALAASGEARHRRAQLARIEPPAALAGTVEELVALRALAPARAAAAITEQVVARWLARPVAGDAQLLATPLGAATIADLLLPPVWDAATDLVVLVGAGLGPVADMLLAFGQRRLIAMIPNAPAEGSAGYPAEVIVCRDLRETVAAVRTMDPCAPARLAVRAALDVPADEVEAAVARVREVLSDLRIHRNTVEAFSRTWIEQGTANLPALASSPTIDAIGARFEGKPLVIVAPGPSLARNVEQLRALRGHAVIVAVSHALRPLLRAGVTPDAVLTVDPQDVRYHFAGVDLAEVGAIINGVTVHPSLFSLGAATTFSVAANAALDAWLLEGVGELAAIASGGSVATSAFGLALRWRCDPIVCVGLDLSFAGSQYYVDTCSDGAARAEVSADGTVRVAGWSDGFRAMKSQGGPAAPTERLIELPGWHGGTVRSTFMFGMFHRWFVEMAARLGESDGPRPRLYNCTEGGAFIEGMAHRPLAAVIQELRAEVPRFEPRAIFVDVAAAHDVAGRRQALARHLQRHRRTLRRIRDLVARCEVMLARPEDAATERRLTALEQQLAAALRPMPFVSLVAQRAIEQAHEVATHAHTTGALRDATRRLLGAVRGAVAAIDPALAGAATALRQARARGQASSSPTIRAAP